MKIKKIMNTHIWLMIFFAFIPCLVLVFVENYFKLLTTENGKLIFYIIFGVSEFITLLLFIHFNFKKKKWLQGYASIFDSFDNIINSSEFQKVYVSFNQKIEKIDQTMKIKKVLYSYSDGYNKWFIVFSISLKLLSFNIDDVEIFSSNTSLNNIDNIEIQNTLSIFNLSQEEINSMNIRSYLKVKMRKKFFTMRESKINFDNFISFFTNLLRDKNNLEHYLGKTKILTKKTINNTMNNSNGNYYANDWKTNYNKYLTNKQNEMKFFWFKRIISNWWFLLFFPIGSIASAIITVLFMEVILRTDVHESIEWNELPLTITVFSSFAIFIIGMILKWLFWRKINKSIDKSLLSKIIYESEGKIKLDNFLSSNDYKFIERTNELIGNANDGVTRYLRRTYILDDLSFGMSGQISENKFELFNLSLAFDKERRFACQMIAEINGNNEDNLIISTLKEGQNLPSKIRINNLSEKFVVSGNRQFINKLIDDEIVLKLNKIMGPKKRFSQVLIKINGNKIEITLLSILDRFKYYRNYLLSNEKQIQHQIDAKDIMTKLIEKIN